MTEPKSLHEIQSEMFHSFITQILAEIMARQDALMELILTIHNSGEEVSTTHLDEQQAARQEKLVKHYRENLMKGLTGMQEAAVDAWNKQN